MANAMLSHFKAMGVVMGNLTDVVTMVFEDPDAEYRADCINCLVSDLFHDTLSAQAFTVTPTDCSIMQPEHEIFLTIFIKLTSVVVAHLKKLDAGDVAEDESFPEFVAVWGSFHNACRGWLKWGEFKTINVRTWKHLPPRPELVSVFADLMMWVLSASRNNSIAWALLNSSKSEERNYPANQINLILIIALQYVFSTLATSPTPAKAIAALLALPQDHVSLLCFLLYKHLGESPDTISTSTSSAAAAAATTNSRNDTPTKVLNRTLITQLAETITQMVEVSGLAPGQALLDSLSTPAVIELLQLEVVLQAEDQQSRPPPNSLTFLTTLIQLVENQKNLMRLTKESGSSNLVSSSTLDLSPQSTISRSRLQHALSGQGPPVEHVLAQTRLRTMGALLGRTA